MRSKEREVHSMEEGELRAESGGLRALSRQQLQLGGAGGGASGGGGDKASWQCGRGRGGWPRGEETEMG
eukprot:3678146-Rhodomonas_salina.2